MRSVTQTIVQQPQLPHQAAAASYTLSMQLSAPAPSLVEKFDNLILQIIDEAENCLPQERVAEIVEMLEKFNSLVLQMINEAENCLPQERVAEIVEMLEEWGVDFFAKNDFCSPLDSTKLQAAQCVYWLRQQLSEELLHAQKLGEVEEVTWGSFILELDQLLSDLLPEGRSVQSFIATCKQREKKKAALLLLPKIQAQRDLLYSSVNSRVEEFSGIYAETDAKFDAVDEACEQSRQRIVEKVDSATEAAKGVDAKMRGVVADAGLVKQQLQQLEKQLDAIAPTVENLMKRG